MKEKEIAPGIRAIVVSEEEREEQLKKAHILVGVLENFPETKNSNSSFKSVGSAPRVKKPRSGKLRR